MCARYEDMLESPDEIFLQILEHLQLTNVNNFEERFDFALEESSFNQLRKYESEKNFIEKGKGERFFRVGKAEQWKTTLSPNQMAKISEDHEDMMEEFNYAKNLV
jgi:hypothetical protein